MLLEEGRQGMLGLGADGHRDAGRHEVEHDDRRVVVPGDGVGEAQGEFRVRAAADGHEDPLDGPRAALLDDRDIGRRLAHDLVDGRREHGRAGLVATGRLAAPAEDDEIRFLLGGGLDDALGRVPADPDQRVDRRPVRGVVEDPLEQATSVTGPCRALGQGHPLGHLDDAQRRQLAGPRIEDGGADPDQFLGRRRVGDRDEDARRERRLGLHATPPATPVADSFHRATRYGFSSSNSRAWRSTRSSAWAVVTSRFSTTKLPTRPK